LLSVKLVVHTVTTGL